MIVGWEIGFYEDLFELSKYKISLTHLCSDCLRELNDLAN